jgi:acetate kinase
VLTVLVVNAGSTSIKLSLVTGEDAAEQVDDVAAVRDRVEAVAHRVVHGGEHYAAPTLVDDDFDRHLESLVALAPLHNAGALDAIRELREELPLVPHVAVFDTAFHRTLPARASTYALPARFRDEWGIRRYGFHGLAVQWAAARVAVPRLVVCHLGGGCSVTAVLDGASVDTTMGFTPLEGVPMATRSGTVDPGALLHVLRRGLISPDALDHALEHASGLLGLGGSDDPRLLTGSLALDVYTYRIAQAIAAMAVALGGLDAIVFSGGVGENSAGVRAAVCGQLEFLGVELAEEANAGARGGAAELASPQSRVRVTALRAREDLVAAQAVRGFLTP